MEVTLSDEARRYIGRFDELTGVAPKDCLVEGDRLVFLLPIGQMGEAIGPDGQTVKRAQERLGVEIELVANADTPERFVESTLAPAAIRGVTISEQNDTVAYVEVAEADRGVAIGNNGHNIDTARQLAARHFDIDDIELT